MKKKKKVTAALSALTLAVGLVSFSPSVSHAAIPASPANSTIFGPNVYVFDDSMSKSDIESVTGAVFNQQESNEFGPERYALLFKPGTYDANVKVGFYTSVAGIGQNPGDVTITGGVNTDAQWDNGNATRNFWRSIENLTIAPTDKSNPSQFAVSQAAPMRRVHVKNDLWLFDLDHTTWNAGWASGGYMADTLVDGQITPASQQQWFARNSSWNNWSNGVWNMVFVGDENVPSGVFPQDPYTKVDTTPVVREKPYLYVDGDGNYQVFVPSLETNTKGVSWADGSTPGTSISIDDFYIAIEGQATSADINAALDAGKNVLFTPGNYHLEDTIHVTNPNTVILGIGLPTLIPDNGQDTMLVDDVDGVTLAGLVFDAGANHSSTLLKIGEDGSNSDHSANPTLLSDIYFRTGGATAGSNDTGLEINSNNVIGDHFWIWRADHGEGAGWTDNVSRNGLIVNGEDVTIYGLFNEHHNEYQTVWNGNGGRLYFYQSEIPYDVPDQQSWMSNGGDTNGYASYKVGDNVTDHEAWGLGIYSYFRDAAVKLNSAIEVPDNPGIKLHHLTTIWLNGTAGSEITHIVNNLGGSVTSSADMRKTYTEFVGNDTEAPTAPTNLTATASGGSEIRLAWDAATDNAGVDSYDIYRNSTYIASTYGTTFSNTGLKANTTYSYKVVAKDSVGNTSPASNTASATTAGGDGKLVRTGWTATANPTSAGDVPSNMFDGVNTSRWSSGAAMQNGQYIIVDMKRFANIQQVVMDSNGSGDYARGYEVYVSADGETWGDAVASGTGTSSLLAINAEASHVRYIKVVQTGTLSNWWSIHEFNVYGTYEDEGSVTPPETEITDKPALISNDSSPSFSFASETGVSFEYSLDNGGEFYVPSFSAITLQGLKDGEHTLYVRAVNAAGDVDVTPAAYAWTIDTVKPVITLNGDSAITLEQGTAFNDPGATASDDLAGNLTEAIVVTGTVDVSVPGVYTLYYNVSDTAGNAADQAVRTIQVNSGDTGEQPQAPDTSIISAPPSVSNNSSPAFTFGSDQEEVTYEYSLDGETYLPNESNAVTLSDLPDGEYTLYVRAVNAAGDADETPASYSWTIDTVKPVITLNGNSTITLVQGTAFTDPGAAASDNYDGDLTDAIVVSGTADVTEPGTYTLDYNVSDAAGNAADQVTRTVIVQSAEEPEALDTTIASKPASVTNATSAAFTFSSNNEQASFEYSLDGDSYSAAESGAITLSDLSDGEYTLYVRAVDEDGNVDETPASYTWTIDTVKPVITLNGNSSIIVEKSSSAFTDPGATASDNRDRGLTDAIVVTGSVDQSKTGTYSLYYNVSDEAGNAADQVTRTVRVVSGVNPSPPLSSNANLKSLSVKASGESVSLTPAFSSSTTSYTARTDQAQVGLSAEAASSAAQISLTVNGKSQTSLTAADLKIGDNVLVWKVTAENGNTKSYTLTITRTDNEQPEIPVFTDIAGHWAESYIRQAAALHIVNGYTDGTFKPDNTVTRAEFVVMLVNALQLQGSGEQLSFNDASDIGTWAKDAVSIAVQAGIIGGYEDGTFRPNATINRAEMAVMIARALKLTASSASASPFEDENQIPQWAKDAIHALEEQGLLEGRDGNQFAPNGTATRAEAAAALLRLLGQQ
ncbi:immunoglobulin-like domain-containing protein [Paenibacillus protaetiae]|uniref:DUF5011 domain-containing protein n=1 Tax=Paenibacillus protaetiae TaxID=2509456 RepID=A0A4P6ER92_9BACL|nr:immunoglobulin-like domain-containing protein [Paenibacillus protaetiae]QAY65384.1 DUF5011 domain-containing protein [Paenibacillus protaetiae]